VVAVRCPTEVAAGASSAKLAADPQKRLGFRGAEV